MVLIYSTDEQLAFSTEFSAELEMTINTVLCAVQTLVKKREGKQPNQLHGNDKRGGNDAFKGTSVVEKKGMFQIMNVASSQCGILQTATELCSAAL